MYNKQKNKRFNLELPLIIILYMLAIIFCIEIIFNNRNDYNSCKITSETPIIDYKSIPVVRVSIPGGKEILISKTEITQGTYKSYIGYNPSIMSIGDNKPVESVSYMDAIIFCNKVSEYWHLEPYYILEGILEGQTSKIIIRENINAKGYRLPTEEEWKIAAHGGWVDNKYYDRDIDDPEKCFYYSGYKSSMPTNEEINDYSWLRFNSGIWAQDVGKKKPNHLGIYDMTGNVAEWLNNGKVIGGSFLSTLGESTIESSSYIMKDNVGFVNIGIRLVRNII